MTRQADIAIASAASWARLIVGLACVFLVFHASAAALGSVRGEAGLVVGAIVVIALLAAEWWLFRCTPPTALRRLGFGPPAASGFGTAIVICAALIAVVPVYDVVRDGEFSRYPGWIWIVPGLFLQGGLAEEALFRGYLFGELRRGRTFWRAATLSAVPFVAVHLFLFATLPWAVALASIALSTVIAFPLVRLYELGGRTIWAPAIVHFVVQATPKLLERADDMVFPLLWILASATIPWLVFLVRQ